MRKKMDYKIPLLINHARRNFDISQYEVERNYCNQLILTHRVTREEIILTFDELTLRFEAKTIS